MGSAPTAIIRQEWLHRVTETCQIFVGRLSVARRRPSPQAIGEFLGRLPAPSSAAETLVLRWLLAELAVRFAAMLHARSPARCLTSCCLAPFAEAFGRPGRHLADPRPAVLEYIGSVLPARRLSPAARLAQQIKEFLDHHYRDHTTMRTLARRFAHTPRSALNVFRHRFGMSPHEYLTRVRVQQAVGVLVQTDLKVEAIALMVGYRSKKDLYRAIRRLTELSPDQVRRHPFAAGLGWLAPEIELPSPNRDQRSGRWTTRRVHRSPGSPRLLAKPRTGKLSA